MATYYVDFSLSADAGTGDGLSFANRKMTIPTLSAGDTVRIMASVLNTDIGTNSQWQNAGTQVQYGGAALSTFAKLLAANNTGWTASTNVTLSNGGGGKSTSSSLGVSTSTSFTTGKAAYYTLGSAMDLSAFNRLNFCFMPTSTIPASTFKVCLCSDTTGDTIVEEYTINFATAANGSRWFPITYSKGSAFGATINSIAIYKVASNATAYTFNLCDVGVSSLVGYVDLIGKGTKIGGVDSSTVIAGVDDEVFWPIRYMTETGGWDEPAAPAIFLDPYSAATSTVTMRGYTGTTGARENTQAYYSTRVAAPASGSQFAITVNNVTISGGWNTTDMSTQTGYSFLHGGAAGSLFNVSGTGCLIERIHAVRWDTGFTWSGADGELKDCGAYACHTAGVSTTGSSTNLKITTKFTGVTGNGTNVSLNSTGQTHLLNADFTVVAQQQSTGINLGAGCMFKHSGSMYVSRCAANGITIGGAGEFDTLTSSNNTGHGIVLNTGGRVDINSVTADSNTQNGIRCSGVGVVRIRSLNNAVANTSDLLGQDVANSHQDIRAILGSTTGTIFNTATSFSLFYHGQLWLQGFSSNPHNRGYVYGGSILSEDTDVQTTGKAWKITISDTKRSEANPISLGRFGEPLRKYVAAGSVVTISVYGKKSHANIKAQIRIPGGQLGLTSDVTTEITSTTSYTQYIANCTPASAGVLEFYIDVWTTGGTTGQYALIDTLSVTQ